jgi:hypothetical protein
VESEVTVGESLVEVAVVVGSVVMVGAEQEAVVQVGVAAGGPGLIGVVGFAPGSGDVAAGGAADPVADGEGLALGGGEQAAGAAQVEGLGVAAEDVRDEAGGAREAAGFARSERIAAGEGGGAEAVTESVEVDRDDQGGGVASMQRQPVGVDGLEERAEGVPEPDLIGATVLRG